MAHRVHRNLKNLFLIHKSLHLREKNVYLFITEIRPSRNGNEKQSRSFLLSLPESAFHKPRQAKPFSSKSFYLLFFCHKYCLRCALNFCKLFNSFFNHCGVINYQIFARDLSFLHGMCSPK